MKQEVKEIKFGLPKGSLNTPERGDTRKVLINAGYDIRGYESGKESPRLVIINDPEITPFLTRPQRSPVDLSRKFLDIAIIGADWVEEERLSSGRLVRKIGDLEYGKTRLVIAVAEKSDYESLSDLLETLRDKECNKPLYCSSEYVNLAARAFMQNEVYRELFGTVSPFIQYRGLIKGRNRRVQILGSDGATESSIEMKYDVIVDNSQRGKSLTDAGLREIGQIMISCAGLYAGPSCIGWKERKAQDIFEKLQGAVRAEKYSLVTCNVRLSKLDGLSDDFIKKGFCANEPTIAKMKRFAAVQILLTQENFPAALRRLKEVYGASAIMVNEVKQYIE